MTLGRLAALLGALIAGTATVSCYAPNPENGKLKCGPNLSCPQGYECTDRVSCFKKGQGVVGGPDRFLGHWVFGASSTQTIACNNGASDTFPLEGDYMDVGVGAVSDLIISYFCPFDVDIAASGNGTVIVPDQICTGTIDGVDYVYYGDSLNFTTSNGQTGNLVASLPYDFVDVTTAGTCSMTITAAVTKMAN